MASFLTDRGRIGWHLLIWAPGALLWVGVLSALPNPTGRWFSTFGTNAVPSPPLSGDAFLGQGIGPPGRPLSHLGLRFILGGPKTDSVAELSLLSGPDPPASLDEVSRRRLARIRLPHKRLRQDSFWSWELDSLLPAAASHLQGKEGLYLLVRLDRIRGTPHLRLWMDRHPDWTGGPARVLWAGPQGPLRTRQLTCHLIMELGHKGQETSLWRGALSRTWSAVTLPGIFLASLLLVIWLVPRPRELLHQLARSRRALLTSFREKRDPAGRPWLLAVAAVCAAYCTASLLNTWMADDAFLTMRTVHNFVSGDGLIWNPAERVQIFTHPLWMFLLSGVYLVLQSAYASAMLLALTCSLLAAGYLALRVARSAPSAFFAVALLVLSQALVDFSTSGLENPLTHLLLVLFAFVLLHDDGSPEALFRMLLLFGLALLCRMDTGLLYLPALATVVWTHLRRRQLSLPGVLRLALLALMPFLSWEVFSLFYYGSLVANTAHAKLVAGIDPLSLMRQGELYLLNSLAWDPVTLVTLATAAFVPLLTPAERGKSWALLAGAWLYVLYVMLSGGCFMSGRMLTAPLFVAAVVWSRLPVKSLQPALLPLLVIAALGLGTRLDPPDPKPGIPRLRWAASGITDERLFYFSEWGLVNLHRDRDMVDRPETRLPKPISKLTCGGAGITGFLTGSGSHVVDPCALGDAFLARLPATGAYTRSWRIGHFMRTLPRGYPRSLTTGQNLLMSPALARYYDKLRVVIAWDLFDPQRPGTIWQLVTGGYDELLSGYETRKVEQAEIAKPRAAGTAWNAPGNLLLAEGGVQIELEKRSFARELELSVDNQGVYRILFFRHGRLIDDVDLGPHPGSGLVLIRMHVPAKSRHLGFDYILILPLRGPNRFSLGHLRLP